MGISVEWVRLKYSCWAPLSGKGYIYLLAVAETAIDLNYFNTSNNEFHCYLAALWITEYIVERIEIADIDSCHRYSCNDSNRQM